jgi:hypothetical protein
MLSCEERAAYEHVSGEMARHVDRFITPISQPEDDDRGRPVGSGTYLQINGFVYLITNEHVARWMMESGIAHLPRRDDKYRRLSPIRVLDFPVDVGIARLDNPSWDGATQVPLPIDRFDDLYAPETEEILFVCGYPVYARRGLTEYEIRQPHRTHFGYLSPPAVPILTYPVSDPDRFPSGLDREIHAVVNYEGVAFRPGEKGLRESPDPSGLSGSLLWDTKFMACEGKGWSPSMARVCGQINRWNDERGLLIATKVEKLRIALLSSVRHEAAFLNWIGRGQPLWDDLVDWDLAERSILGLMP